MGDRRTLFARDRGRNYCGQGTPIGIKTERAYGHARDSHRGRPAVRFAAVVLLSAGAASAQVSAPLLGWMPSGTQIRPMNGLPAAAALGRPANVGHELTHIAVSPSQDYVLASDARTG